jgi:hypothetical protein
VKRRILYDLVGAMVFAGAAGYLFSLLPKSTTPRFVYLAAPICVIDAVVLVIDAILRVRRPDLQMFKRVDPRPSLDEVWRMMWSGKRAAAYWLAWVGGLMGAMVAFAPDIQYTVAGVAFAEIAITLGLGSAGCGAMVRTAPKRSGQALLVASGLLVVLALCVPLFDLQGPDWLATGFHPAYFFIASAVLVFAAGILALRAAKEADGRPALRASNEGVS